MKNKIKGFENVSKFENFLIDREIKKYFKKITRTVGEPTGFRFFIKTYFTKGKNKMTSIHIEIKLNNRKFEADKKGWNSTKVTKSCFEKILNQMEHEFHVSDTKHAFRKRPKSKKLPKNFKKFYKELRKS
mgnify:CR=1 FL=1